MIIQGKPELGLQKHQQDAYQLVQKAYETKDKASVVIPTGCGKSFIALQLMADNKDKRILFMAPSNAIKNQMYNYIAKYIVGEEASSERPAKMIADEYFPNLKIMLYPSLLRVKDEQMDKIQPDIIIMDELHRTGADKWGERINTLLEKNPNAKILGLTATPDRMDDKNVIDKLFEGSIDYELTLVEALRDRIVKVPTYVKCDYALDEHLEGIRTAIANCSDEQKKKELQDRYEKMRKIVEQADGVPELFAKNIKKKDGKYIIFCKNKTHMDELMSKAKEWFGAIDDNPEIYSVFSGEGYTENDNRKSIEAFENSKSEHLKLLFSIEMLNEGLHVEDISGVIMARPTDSRIIYLQQLGRALSSDTSREKTIVFDLVNNYLKNNLDAEINKRTNGNHRGNDDIGGGHEDGPQGDIEDIDIFRIQGETRDFLDLLDEVQGIISSRVFLLRAKEIQKWIQESGKKIPPRTQNKNKTVPIEEARLGESLKYIRTSLINPYLTLDTDEQREKYRDEYPELEEVMKIIREIDENNIPIKLLNARNIKNWMEENKTTKPPSQLAKDERERSLAIQLSNIRQTLIKPYLMKETEEEKDEFRKEHPELEEIMKIVQQIDEKNTPIFLINARAIREWMDKNKSLNPPSQGSHDIIEKDLAMKLSRIRANVIRNFINLSKEKQEEVLKTDIATAEIIRIISEIDAKKIPLKLQQATEIKKWVLKNNKFPNRRSINEEEKDLGKALKNIRGDLIKPFTQSESEQQRTRFREQHPETDEVLDIISELDMQYGTQKQKELAILIRQDLEKRKVLQEAKKLEQNYEQQLSIKKGELAEDTQEQGVDYNE